MPGESIWAALDAALDRVAAQDEAVAVWLRDDDAVTATPALDRLTVIGTRHRLPVLLAVIPQPADERLAEHVTAHPMLIPTQHGYAHLNHAAPGERARELGGIRPVETVLDELARGRDKLRTLFGKRLADILVPPWNRIDEAVLPHLHNIGFDALSTFATAHEAIRDIDIINCDLDIIDWKNGRRCHPHAKLVGKLCALIADRAGTRRPIGLLTHHLAHDEDAWTFLDACLTRLGAHQAARFITAGDARAMLRR